MNQQRQEPSGRITREKAPHAEAAALSAWTTRVRSLERVSGEHHAEER
jgi:hypothetical protein